MSDENLKDLSVDNLEKKLLEFTQKLFALNMKKASGSEELKTHEIRFVRKQIARVNTFLTEKKANSRSERRNSLNKVSDGSGV